jgi:SgrR family transcriptional regulator
LFLEKAISWIKNGEVPKIFNLIEQLDENQRQAFYSILPQAFGFHEIKNETEKRDVLTFPYFRQLFSLNPAYVERQSERHMVSQCLDTLIEYNSTSKKFTPKLAHYWTFSHDLTEWTFYLRKGVYFHHGRELTSQDIAFTFNQLKDSPMKWVLESLTNVIELDLYTVKFNFLRPQFYWLDLLSSPKLSIIPDQYGGITPELFNFKPIGTGPYQIIERTYQQLTLEAHPTYFCGRAHLDRIVMVFAPEIEHYVSQQSFNGEMVTYFEIEKPLA